MWRYRFSTNHKPAFFPLLRLSGRVCIYDNNEGLPFFYLGWKSWLKMERFVELTDEELSRFVEEQEDKNTRRKTDYDVQLFVKFLEKERPHLNSSIHELTTTELNELSLLSFVYLRCLIERRMVQTMSMSQAVWEESLEVSKGTWTVKSTAIRSSKQPRTAVNSV